MGPVDNWPFRLHARAKIASETLGSLFPPSDTTITHLSGAGLSFVSLHLELPQVTGNKGGKGNERVVFHLLDVDTLSADVQEDPPNWALTGYWDYPPDTTRHHMRIEIVFPDGDYLNAFLLALSYVRLSQGRLPVERFSLQKVPLGQTQFNSLHADGFLTMRSTAYELAPIHSIPFELLSTIFLRLPPSQDQHDSLGSPLLLLRVCSTWRAVAIETAGLWRCPAFILGPSFFSSSHDSLCSQISSWLTRTKSLSVILSLHFRDSEYLPNENSRIRGFHSSFGAVQTLRLSCPPSHLHHFLGHGVTSFPSMTTLSLTITGSLDLHFWPSSIKFKLCRLAPLLRSLTIDTECFTCGYASPGFIIAFPWSRLTSITIRIELAVSTWMPVFSQCLSLQRGKFILWDDGYGYPLGTVTFHDLVSLRVSSRHACDTSFLAHVALPVIRKLHIAGLTNNSDADTRFIPSFPTLRTLILDVELPGNVLQQVIRAHADLEQLSVFTQADGTLSPAIWELPRIKMLTISSYITSVELVYRFTHNTTPRIVRAVSAGCHLRFFGETDVRNGLLAMLVKERAVTASLVFNPSADPFDDPLELFPYCCFHFVNVERPAS